MLFILHHYTISSIVTNTIPLISHTTVTIIILIMTTIIDITNHNFCYFLLSLFFLTLQLLSLTLQYYHRYFHNACIMTTFVTIILM